MVILAVGKVVKVGNLGFPGVVLRLGPLVHRLDLLDSVAVLLVELSFDATEVGDPLVVVLRRPLLKTLDLGRGDMIFMQTFVFQPRSFSDHFPWSLSFQSCCDRTWKRAIYKGPEKTQGKEVVLEPNVHSERSSQDLPKFVVVRLQRVKLLLSVVIGVNQPLQ